MTTRVLKRLNLGFAAGALTGGVVVATAFALGFAPDLVGMAQTWLFAFLFATVIWGLGLTIIGYPIWWVLEKRGVRGPFVAVTSGVISVYAIGLLWPPDSLDGLVEPGRILMASSGGIVGLVIERVAYGRPGQPKPPPARPS